MAASVALTSSLAAAQTGPLPQLPGDPATPVQPSPGQAPPVVTQPQPPPQPPPPPIYYGESIPPRPAPFQHQEAPEPVHAPQYALYTGASLSYIGYGGYFYINEQGASETTGNFAKNGPAIELNVGARLGKRYIPFLLWEHGFMRKGHRFEGTEATATSDLVGLGFRYMAGDVDHAGFLSELSVGVRTITIRNGEETYKMSTWEIFRLGLGAEIRFSKLFTISPMGHVSSGVMNDTDGDIRFGDEGSKDGIKHPTFTHGRNIQSGRGYIVVGIGCGAHFDFFGK